MFNTRNYFLIVIVAIFLAGCATGTGKSAGQKSSASTSKNRNRLLLGQAARLKRMLSNGNTLRVAVKTGMPTDGQLLIVSTKADATPAASQKDDSPVKEITTGAAG